MKSYFRDVKTSRDTKAKEGRGARGRGAKSDRGKGRGGLIQTQGLFSEGAGTALLKTRASSSGGGGGSSARDAVQLQKPTINKKDNLKIDLDNEQKHLDETMPDDEDEDLDDKASISKSLPILLNNRK